MENALLVGLSRQMALSHELDIVANNIANINTTGYKADNTLFAQYLMPDARDDDFTGNDRRISFVDRPRQLDQFRPRRAFSAPAIRSTSPSTATPTSRCRRRAASATPATARFRSARPASSSPAKAIRCSATTARSRFSPAITT